MTPQADLLAHRLDQLARTAHDAANAIRNTALTTTQHDTWCDHVLIHACLTSAAWEHWAASTEGISA